MSRQCVSCGREIPDSEYNFTCDFCKFEQMRIEENFRKRLRDAYDEGKAAGYKLAVKEVLLQVNVMIDNADHVVNEDEHYYCCQAGYDIHDVEKGFNEIFKHFEVEL